MIAHTRTYVGVSRRRRRRRRRPLPPRGRREGDQITTSFFFPPYLSPSSYLRSLNRLIYYSDALFLLSFSSCAVRFVLYGALPPKILLRHIRGWVSALEFQAAFTGVETETYSRHPQKGSWWWWWWHSYWISFPFLPSSPFLFTPMFPLSRLFPEHST